jgi:cytochrome c oxidase assembly factor CtaG
VPCPPVLQVVLAAAGEGATLTGAVRRSMLSAEPHPAAARATITAAATIPAAFESISKSCADANAKTPPRSGGVGAPAGAATADAIEHPFEMGLDLAFEWSTITSITLPLLIGVAYFVRVGQLREQGRQPSIVRQASFAGGIALIVLATVGPMDELADDFVYGHMIQHTILFDQAALLLAIGLTGPVLIPILTKRGMRHFQVLMHPVVAVAIWLLVMYGWHLPPCYQLAAEHEGVHLCEHACFIAAGTIMWLALLGPFPKPEWFGNGAKAIYVAVIHFSTMGLANILMWSGSVLYPFYVASDHAHGIEPLTDQSLSGVVLMIQSGVVMLGALFWLVLRWAREDTERQELIDLAFEQGVELDPRRAGRAVASGRGAELRRKLVSRGKGIENTS